VWSKLLLNRKRLWFVAGSRPIKTGGQNQNNYATTPGRFIGIIRYVPGSDKPDLSRVEWCVIRQKMPLMLRNRYAKDIGGISTGQKIIHNKSQEGVVLTPSLGIGGLTTQC